jgi:hypothetical protein
MTKEEFKNILYDIKGKIIYNKVSKSYKYDGDILQGLELLIVDVSSSYDAYCERISILLPDLEEIKSESLMYLENLFSSKLDYIMKEVKPTQEQFPYNINYDFESVFEKLQHLMETSFSKNNVIRLSGDYELSKELSTAELKECLELSFNILYDAATTREAAVDTLDTRNLTATIMRQIALKVGNPVFFYNTIGLLVDKLDNLGEHQASRNMAEELVLSSYKDKLPDYGFYNYFKSYANQGNLISGLVYGNLFLTKLLSTKKISNYLYKHIIWQTIKLYRNSSIHSRAIEIFESVNWDYYDNDHEKRAITQTYFHSLLHLVNAKTPYLVSDFLNKEREEIIKGGEEEALPWLILLLNLERIFGKEKINEHGLDYYIIFFKQICPKEKYEKNEKIISGDIKSLKVYLKEELVRLETTKFKADFIYDNSNALLYASRLMSNPDVEGFLLAMIVKSDFSFVFKNKTTENVREVKQIEISEKEFEKIYGNAEEYISSTFLNENVELLWIAKAEKHYFQLNYYNDFVIKHLSHFNTTDLEKFYKYLGTLLLFQTTKQSKSGQIIGLVTEDYEAQSITVNNGIPFEMEFLNEVSPLFVVKDIDITNYPHNLLKNRNRDFIYLQRPICNMLSLEWLKENKSKNTIPASYTKSIFIPHEDGDLIINQLYNSISNYIFENNFKTSFSQNALEPLSSNINIVVSHGKEDISTFNTITSDSNTFIFNPDKILGEGQIAILLICHSGSMKSDLFSNSTATYLKQILKLGYQGIIAPFWGLDIDLLPHWLPAFFNSLNEGFPAYQACHYANMKLNEIFPSPSSWGCLHFYGNPYLKIQTISTNRK